MVVAFNGNNVDRHSHNREYRNDYNRERKNSQTVNLQFRIVNNIYRFIVIVDGDLW